MYFSRLEIENVGPHARGAWTLPCGLVGIVGPNGSGKSTLVEAIAFALTGRFAGDGVKLDWVHDRAPPGAAAFVRLAVVLDDGREITIRRDVRGDASVRLAVPGERDITTAAKANERLESLLGYSRDDLDLLVFRRQGRLDEFITMRPADRKRLFGRMFGLARCEAIHTALGAELNPDRVALEVERRRMADHEAAFAAADQAQLDLVAVAEQIRRQSGRLLSGESLASAERVLRAETQLCRAEF